jgi:hypothetical protein
MVVKKHFTMYELQFRFFVLIDEINVSQIDWCVISIFLKICVYSFNDIIAMLGSLFK